MSNIPSVSFEFFPPRTEEGISNLNKTVKLLSKNDNTNNTSIANIKLNQNMLCDTLDTRISSSNINRDRDEDRLSSLCDVQKMVSHIQILQLMKFLY